MLVIMSESPNIKFYKTQHKLLIVNLETFHAIWNFTRPINRPEKCGSKVNQFFITLISVCIYHNNVNANTANGYQIGNPSS